MNEPYPFKRVINTQDVTTRYNRAGEGSRWHYLECGHSIVTKQSAGFPSKKRCRDCAFGRPADDQLQVGQRIKAVVTSDTRNTHFKYPVTGELIVTEVSTDNKIITANLYPDGHKGFGGVTWPQWKRV